MTYKHLRVALISLSLLGGVGVIAQQPSALPPMVIAPSPAVAPMGVNVAFTRGGTVVAALTSGGLSVLSSLGIGFSTDPLNNGMDTQITRVAAGEFGYTAVAFASLGTPASGTFAYCNDCTIANPCAGAGTGAFAKRLNGVWVCN